MKSLLPDGLWPLVCASGEAHALGVARLAELSAPHLGLDPGHAWLAGTLHDIGKLNIPQSILHTPGPLTPDARLVIQTHPAEGAGLLLHRWPTVPAGVLHAVRHHHERTDGSGYPDGLRELPPLTLLIAACDVYDALRSERPYRAAWTISQARRCLLEQALPTAILTVVLDQTCRPKADELRGAS